MTSLLLIEGNTLGDHEATLIELMVCCIQQFDTGKFPAGCEPPKAVCIVDI